MKITRAVLRGCYQFLHHVNAIHDWTSSMGVWEICVDRWGVWLANKRTGTPIHLPTYLAIESYVQTLRGGLTSLPRESASRVCLARVASCPNVENARQASEAQRKRVRNYEASLISPRSSLAARHASVQGRYALCEAVLHCLYRVFEHDLSQVS